MAVEITEEFVWQSIPPRARDSHKGTFGSVLAVAGSAFYRGAALLARAAADAGEDATWQGHLEAGNRQLETLNAQYEAAKEKALASADVAKQLDIDTLDVFYCYYSASCERNLADYNADDYYNASALLGSFASALDYDGFQKIPEGIEDNVPFEVRLTNSAAGEERSYECRMHTYSDSASLLVDREFTLTG